MRIQFEITFEEFREAQARHAGMKVVSRWKSAWLLLFLAAAIAAYWAAYEYLFPPVRSADPPDPLVHDVLLPMFAWGMILGGSLLVVAMSQKIYTGKPWENRPPLGSGRAKKRVNVPLRRFLLCLGGLLFLILIFVFQEYSVDEETHQIHATGSASGMWLVPMIFYYVYMCWAQIVQMVVQRNSTREGWAKQEHLRREMVLEADAIGVMLTSQFSRSHLQWEYFLGMCRGGKRFYAL